MTTREEAILICAIAASNHPTPSHYCVREWMGIGHESNGRKLALNAWVECSDLDRPDAEAECLLREGWNPGDPVEVLR